MCSCFIGPYFRTYVELVTLNPPSSFPSPLDSSLLSFLPNQKKKNLSLLFSYLVVVVVLLHLTYLLHLISRHCLLLHQLHISSLPVSSHLSSSPPFVIVSSTPPTRTLLICVRCLSLCHRLCHKLLHLFLKSMSHSRLVCDFNFQI